MKFRREVRDDALISTMLVKRVIRLKAYYMNANLIASARVSWYELEIWYSPQNYLIINLRDLDKQVVYYISIIYAMTINICKFSLLQETSRQK